MKYLTKISFQLAIISSISLGALPLQALAAGPAPIDLLSAANFVILSQTGITNTGSHATSITGNIGSSPITAAAMNTVFCSEISGTIYGVDSAYVGSGTQTCFAGNPPLSNKTLIDNAVADMGTAYTDAAGRTLPTATELGAGNIGGMTLAPGLYKWSTDVTIPTNVTLSGNSNDVWIFQIAGNLNIASAGSVPAGIKVILSGGAQAANVFWQVGGVTGATLGTYSTFNGTILTAKQVIVQTGAVLNGRALAQTQVVLDANNISLSTTTGSTLSGTLTGTVIATTTAATTTSGTLTGTVVAPVSTVSGSVGGGAGGGGSISPVVTTTTTTGSGGGGGGITITPVPVGTTGGSVLGESTTVPNLPNTGAGGEAPIAIFALWLSAVTALLGSGYLARQLMSRKDIEGR